RYRPGHVSVLALLWLSLIYYNERYEVNRTIKSCHWDNWETWNASGSTTANPYRVALVADPQLVDDHTYVGRPRPLLAITRFIVDLYLRKHWVYINQVLKSDSTLFLGDLFDGGRDWDDKVWFEEYERWNGIFGKSSKDVIMSLPGNHDIGYGDTIHPFALERFRSVFGETSQTLDRGNHTFVLLDTISMENKINQTIYEPHYNFMKELGQTTELFPRILLTHVPLYRPPGVSCGAKRESLNPFPLTRGDQYQTVLDSDVSSDVLTNIRPVVIFSGDDHDACHVKHTYQKEQNQSPAIANEYTVKSMSMAMGISRPGIQLLSLNNPSNYLNENAETYQTRVCLMAPPYQPFIRYGELAFLTLIILAVVAYTP
ncbi:Metallo-dependent phosphatase, partial [Nadsonia fulvescens var. elongata DSM 6958]